MFLKINNELLPLEGAHIHLLWSNSETLEAGVQIRTPAGWVFRFPEGEVAEALRIFFASLEKKGDVIDLGKAFKQSQAVLPAPPSPLAPPTAKISYPTQPIDPVPCPLADFHIQMRFGCPSCGLIQGT